MTVVINGTTGIDTIQDSIVTDSKLSLTANSQEIKDALNASGTAPVYACRAWVNFNGTGTVAINASGNVSSITDNGTGDYTVNFTNAMPDANFSFAGSGKIDTANTDNNSAMVGYRRSSSNPTTTACRIAFTSYTNSAIDCVICNATFFR